MKSTGPRKTFDPVAGALTQSLGVEPDHPLYSLLHDVASTARQHRLPINVDALAFTIARKPALQERWAAQKKVDGDQIAQRISNALQEYPAQGVTGEQEAA